MGPINDFSYSNKNIPIFNKTLYNINSNYFKRWLKTYCFTLLLSSAGCGSIYRATDKICENIKSKNYKQLPVSIVSGAIEGALVNATLFFMAPLIFTGFAHKHIFSENKKNFKDRE